MHQELPTINGDLLRLRREERGWALSDLATRACMSIKQIRQLEEGGSSAFYSETIKWTSAKKVGSLLGMQPEEVFVQETPEATLAPAVEAVDDAVAAHTPEVTTEQTATPGVLQTESASEQDTPLAQTDEVQASPQASKNPVLALAALFVAALAVAAWMRPAPEVVTEPAPPVLQNMVTEANDAASSASAATAAPTATANVAASAASQAQKPASTAQAATAAVAPATATASVTGSGSVAASAARAATPAASAAPVAGVKPANALQAPASAASAASKSL